MKKIFTTLFALLIISIAIATTYTTIIIDGVNDFESDEDVAGTSSATYFITWDATNLYLGLQAPDVSSNSSQRWVYFYLDSDPQLIATNGTGSTTGLKYNTQQPGLPFTANYHFRWRTDNGYQNLQSFNGSSWVDGNQTGVAAFQSGTYVEFRIPLANIGSPTQIYLVGAMINEAGGGEWTYHMMPQNNHTEGYEVDFVSRFGFNLTAGISPDNPAYVDIALPVELTSFSATTIGKDVKLSWRTATEINNYGFEVERNTPLNPLSRGEAEGRGVWEKIGFVNGNGNSNSPKDYSFVDDFAGKPAYRTGRYSYRLKQIDNDGQFEYSKTIEVDFNVVKKYELSQNYPNPFNPATKISWQSPVSSWQTLKVYNLLGKEVATLVNEFREAGSYSVNFDASNLPSGVYLYKLQVGDFTQTKKMTLVK
ncbi:MAG: T9SS type A sorting domain-containing protein [Ignavibacteriales bacterium]|nr:T9SS type A sorting domain-containing protein [Ignavibacteriales bacterium]